jgi:large subunit ribosomal protein L15
VKLHELKPKKGSRKQSRRLGRGISAGQGASCGKGMRGQKARSGPSPFRGFEGGQMPLYRRVPKLKHFTKVNSPRYTIINIGRLAALEANTKVTLEVLNEAGLINDAEGPLKVLGDGEIKIPLQVKADAFSNSARQKIESAGGSATVIDEIEIEEIKSRFASLTQNWEYKTQLFSSTTRIISHYAYQEIIKLGREHPKLIVPLIADKLKSEKPKHWFAALREITGENPVSKQIAGKVDKMAASWISFFKERGYID